MSLLPARPSLWNPNAACLWSLLFSPVFGAVIHAKNWRAMGDLSRARTSVLWAWGTVVYALVIAVLDGPRFSSLVFLLAWYTASAYPQIKFVSQHYGTEYSKKGWVLPISIALVIYGLVVAINFASLALGENIEGE